jgi:hypothetical protein
MITARIVNSPDDLSKVIVFLTDDVKLHGGSASEIINMHGQLYDITISDSPWGLITIKEPITYLEAWARFTAMVSE